MISHNAENFLHSYNLYWGRLSLNTTFGMPCHANIPLLWVITLSDEAFDSWASLKYLLVQCFTIGYYLLRHTKKLVVMFQTCLRISCSKTSSQGFNSCSFWQML